MSLLLFVLAALGLLCLAAAGIFAVKRWGVDFLSDFVSDKAAKVIAVILMVVIFLGASAEIGKIWLTQYHNDHWATCTVRSTDRATKGGMRVYTKDCGTLRVADTNWHFNRHSADTYGVIEPGKMRLHIVGSRVGLFSWMPNILEAKKAG